MTKAPHTGTSHPLVVAYLDDLERALAPADGQERRDTIASVTEHLTDALGGDAEPTTEQVQAALADLGPVDQIAAGATPASATPTSATPVSATPASAPVPADEPRRRDWVAPTLLGVSIVSLVLPLFGALLAVGCIVAAAVLLRSESPRRGLLRATIGVSIATLVFTTFFTVTSVAWYTPANRAKSPATNESWA